MENGSLGKKVFFLYPPPVLDEVLTALANQEFEVYFARDHERLARAVKELGSSIVFINLDEGLDEEGWKAYVRRLREECPEVGIGAFTFNDDPALRESYIAELQVPCGFIVLKIGTAKTAEILMKTLEANEARGKRHFVRAVCPVGSSQCAMDFEGALLRAEVSNLSSAGMAVRFEGGTGLRVGTVLRDISIAVKGQRVAASGIIVAKNEGADSGTYVLMFDPGSLDDVRRDKLRNMVLKLNQTAMDLVLEKA